MTAIESDRAGNRGQKLHWTSAGYLPLLAAHPCVDACRGRWNVGVAFGRACGYVLFTNDVQACAM